jgi:glycosyltransferase involved in cell wall biosynthesis
VNRRPIVHQFTAVLAGRDAVGQHTLAVDRLLRDMGAETEIFAAHVHPEVRDRGRDFREHAAGPAPDLMLYQTSTGSPVGDYVMSRPERLVLNYHNMTPAEFFDPWEPAVAAELDHGRRQLARLARRADHAIAVSQYNADELSALGMPPTSVSVSPVLFRPLWVSQGSASASSADLVGDSGASSPGQATLLFVGRLAPNKCQQDLVGVLAGVVALGVDARLVLVGGASSSGFVDAVVALAEGLGVSDRLVVTGSVSEAELVGFYESADVFVSMSEHEGFCVPVVEALGFGVPVVAFGAAAVPETLGGAGLVVGGGGAEKSVGVVAEAVVRVLSDPVVREGLVSRGRVRARELGLSASTARMRATLQPLLDASRPPGAES